MLTGLSVALLCNCLFDKGDKGNGPASGISCPEGLQLTQTGVGFDYAKFQWKPCGNGNLRNYFLDMVTDTASGGPYQNRTKVDPTEDTGRIYALTPGSSGYVRLTAYFPGPSQLDGPWIAFSTTGELGDFSPMAAHSVWRYGYVKRYSPSSGYALPDSGSLTFTLETLAVSGPTVIAKVRYHGVIALAKPLPTRPDYPDTLFQDGLLTFIDSAGAMACVDCGSMEFHPFAERHIFHAAELARVSDGTDAVYLHFNARSASHPFRTTAYLPDVGCIYRNEPLGTGPDFDPVETYWLQSFNGRPIDGLRWGEHF